MSTVDPPRSPQEHPRILGNFWSKVRKAGEDECWIWTASKRNKGYGAFTYVWNGKSIQDRSHRFSYVLHVGPIPDGLMVLHECDNPPCVNPAHLFLGTNQDNIEDMLTKGRHVPGGTHCGENNRYRKGIDHPFARLNPEIIRQIRDDHADNNLSCGSLACKYGIRTIHAWKIVNRRLWKHVT